MWENLALPLRQEALQLGDPGSQPPRLGTQPPRLDPARLFAASSVVITNARFVRSKKRTPSQPERQATPSPNASLEIADRDLATRQLVLLPSGNRLVALTASLRLPQPKTLERRVDPGTPPPAAVVPVLLAFKDEVLAHPYPFVDRLLLAQIASSSGRREDLQHETWERPLEPDPVVRPWPPGHPERHEHVPAPRPVASRSRPSRRSVRCLRSLPAPGRAATAPARLSRPDSGGGESWVRALPRGPWVTTGNPSPPGLSCAMTIRPPAPDPQPRPSAFCDCPHRLVTTAGEAYHPGSCDSAPLERDERYVTTSLARNSVVAAPFRTKNRARPTSLTHTALLERSHCTTRMRRP